MAYQGRDLSTGRSEIYYYTSTSGGETSISASTAGIPISYTVGWVAVYLNGIRLHDSDFTATTGSSITGLSALTKDDVVIIEAMHTFSSSDSVPATGGTFSGAITAPSIQLSSNIIKASDGGTAITLDTSDNVTLAGTANNVGTVTAGTLGSAVSYPARMKDIGGGTAGWVGTTTGTLTLTGASETPSYVVVDIMNGPLTADLDDTWAKTSRWTTDHNTAGVTGFNSSADASDTSYFMKCTFSAFTSTGCTFTRAQGGSSAPGGDFITIFYRFYK